MKTGGYLLAWLVIFLIALSRADETLPCLVGVLDPLPPIWALAASLAGLTAAAFSSNFFIMYPVSRAEIIELTDAEGAFFASRAAAFPTATPDQWALADAFDPASRTPDGEWWLRFRAFAIRLPDGRVIMVDSGIGPAHAPAASWAPVPGVLPASLAAAGIDPAEVTEVVLTHLHTDHVGWAVTGLFPRAALLVQRAELSWSNLDLPKDNLVLLDGDSTLAAGVEIVATPGHTPGHQSVIVDDRVVITGDLLVHALQLVAPEVAYTHEMDADLARDSRIALLSRGLTLATPHLSEPFVTLAQPARG